jgi:hypothetical protein
MTTPVKLERCPVTDAMIEAGFAELRACFPQLTLNYRDEVEQVYRAMHQASRIDEGIVSEEVVKRVAFAIRHARNERGHSWTGMRVPLRDDELDDARAAIAALHTLSVGGGQ